MLNSTDESFSFLIFIGKTFIGAVFIFIYKIYGNSCIIDIIESDFHDII